MNMEAFPDGDSTRLRHCVTCAHPRGHGLVEFFGLFDHYPVPGVEAEHLAVGSLGDLFRPAWPLV